MLNNLCTKAELIFWWIKGTNDGVWAWTATTLIPPSCKGMPLPNLKFSIKQLCQLNIFLALTSLLYATFAGTEGNMEKLWANITKTWGKNNLRLWWHTKAFLAGSCSTLQMSAGRQAEDSVTRSSFIIISGPLWAYASPGLEVSANPLGCLASASQRRCSRNTATALHILFWFGWFIVL